MIIDAPMPEHLSAVLNSPQFDDDSGITIEAVKYIEDRVELTFDIKFSEGPQQQWLLTVRHVEAERFIREWTQSIAMYSEHPLLLDYTEIETELYFRGTTSKANELFLDIFNSITQLSEYLDDVMQFILLPKEVTKLSQQEYGLFARGPKTILKIYQQCLSDHGIHAYFIDENKSALNGQDLKLFMLGDSFIIGQSFLFERQA